MILKNLHKYYGNFCAVNNVSVSISKGECFGLLGLNGAGKTTTFKMMTGDELISTGEAYLDGYSVNADIKKVRGSVLVFIKKDESIYSHINIS